MQTLIWMLIAFGTIWCLTFAVLVFLIGRFIREDHKRKPQPVRAHIEDAIRLVRGSDSSWMVRDKSMGRDIGPFISEESAQAFANRSHNLVVVRKEF